MLGDTEEGEEEVHTSGDDQYSMGSTVDTVTCCVVTGGDHTPTGSVS